VVLLTGFHTGIFLLGVGDLYSKLKCIGRWYAQYIGCRESGSMPPCLPPKNSYPKIQSPSYDSLVEVPEFLVDYAQNDHRFCVECSFC